MQNIHIINIETKIFLWERHLHSLKAKKQRKIGLKFAI